MIYLTLETGVGQNLLRGRLKVKIQKDGKGVVKVAITEMEMLVKEIIMIVVGNHEESHQNPIQKREKSQDRLHKDQKEEKMMDISSKIFRMYIICYLNKILISYSILIYNLNHLVWIIFE